MEQGPRSTQTLSDFLKELRDQLRGVYPESYWVSGETAGIKVYQNATYFELLELQGGKKVAQIKVSAFIGEGINAIRSFEKLTGQKFVAGMKIGARFRVNFHPVNGLSLVLVEIDAEMTLGGIELQRQNTLKLLLARYPAHVQQTETGYWSSNKALPLPLVMQKIAIVSSANAEGYHDFVHTLDHNEYGIRFHTRLFQTTVHGGQAAQDIIGAFRSIYDSGERYDGIALIRGGGSPGDFMPYDDEQLAIVVARARYPVITGIGHHNNQGICDMLAAVHEKTPTAAARFLVDRACTFQQRLEQLAAQISHTTQQTVRLKQQDIAERKQQLSGLAGGWLNKKTQQFQHIVSLIGPQAGYTIKSQQKEISRIATDLARLPQKNLALKTDRLQTLAAHIQSLGPQRTLERGFAIISRKNVILKDGKSLKTGEDVTIRFAAETAEARITDIKNTNGNSTDL
jgi:exodeoxyribonuclease VII large subunit